MKKLVPVAVVGAALAFAAPASAAPQFANYGQCAQAIAEVHNEGGILVINIPAGNFVITSPRQLAEVFDPRKSQGENEGIPIGCANL
jgi:hypothetical protein